MIAYSTMSCPSSSSQLRLNTRMARSPIDTENLGRTAFRPASNGCNLGSSLRHPHHPPQCPCQY
jgi:hypothetical protein